MKELAILGLPAAASERHIKHRPELKGIFGKGGLGASLARANQEIQDTINNNNVASTSSTGTETLHCRQEKSSKQLDGAIQL